MLRRNKENVKGIVHTNKTTIEEGNKYFENMPGEEERDHKQIVKEVLTTKNTEIPLKETTKTLKP